MKRHFAVRERPLTLAEVCEAIASGKVPSQQEDGFYKVSQWDLSHLRHQTAARVVLSTLRPAGLAS